MRALTARPTGAKRVRVHAARKSREDRDRRDDRKRNLFSGRSHRLHRFPAHGVSSLSAIMSLSPLLRSARCQPRRCMFLRRTSPPTTDSDTLTAGLSTTSVSRAITKFKMPAMSPTMTEGGIASWKKREGDSFTAGDVLLEIVCHEHQRIARGTTPMTSPRPYRKRTKQLLT